MQSLLRWSIENSQPGTSPQPTERGKLDPELIDMILGKPDAELMKEALAVAVDETRDEDARVQALDNFEMVRTCFQGRLRVSTSDNGFTSLSRASTTQMVCCSRVPQVISLI